MEFGWFGFSIQMTSLSMGRLASPFIGQGEGTGYTRDRERIRRKKGS
jgi:hypothetical protein